MKVTDPVCSNCRCVLLALLAGCGAVLPPLDAGLLADAGLRVDAGTQDDAGLLSDAGGDGGSTVDAGLDAGRPGPGDGGAVELPLEVNNDLPFARAEVAFSSVPLPRSAGVLDTSTLQVLDGAGDAVPAQFTAVARWGATVADSQAPLKWVGVALDVAVPANQRGRWTLVQRSPQAPASLLSSLGAGRYRVSTGVADFTLDPLVAGALISARVGGVELLQGPAGPVVVDDGGNVLAAVVDPAGFEIEEEGAVRVVVRVRGHFAQSAPSGSACASPLAWAARLSFARGQGTVGLEWDLHNECGEGQIDGQSPEGADFFSRVYRIREARWDVPLQLPSATHAVRVEGSVRRSLATAAVSGVVQGAGQSRVLAGVTVWRRARLMLAGAQVEEREAFGEPTVALGNTQHTVLLSAAWLRFREPVSIAARGSTLSWALVAEPLALGEAQIRWGFCELDFTGALDDGQLALRSRAQLARLERGLLVTTPVAAINAAHVKPRLPERAAGARLEAYSTRIASLHAATLVGFERWKKYGLVWPDTLSNDAWAPDALDPTGSSSGSNYWSASASEFAEYLRTGDPRWAWEVAYPLEQTFLKAHVYNRGTRHDAGDVRSGFTAGSSLIGSNQQAGTAFRAGWNSDDYLYVQGSDEAYLLRYSGALRDVFAQACRSALSRYGGTGARSQFLSERLITRQTTQHFSMLRYAAEFVRDPVLAGQCRDLLLDVIGELGRDNLFGGIACSAEQGNQPTCSTEQNFMYSALTSEFLWGVNNQWGRQPEAVALHGVLVTMAQQYYQTLMPHLSGSTEIDLAGTWAKFLECTFDAQGRLLACIGTQGNEPSWVEERPSHLAVVLVGDALRESPELCPVGARALGSALASDLWRGWTLPASGAGWYKGSAQAMQNVVFGIGVAEACSPD